jgi:hypothetical protein
MVKTMIDCGWQQPHVDMHVKFWSNIKGHPWRSSCIESEQCALLIYQGNQRRKWHTTISGPQAFNLAIINDKVLSDAHACLVQKVNSDQYRLIQCALDKLSQLNDKHGLSSATSSSQIGPSHSCSASGSQKQAISPSSGSPSYMPKKLHSFRTSNQQQLNDFVAQLLSISAVCLGRHKHNIMRCSTARTWDDKHKTCAEWLRTGLFTKSGKQLCAKWQKANGCLNTHCALHICSGCGSKSHGGTHRPFPVLTPLYHTQTWSPRKIQGRPKIFFPLIPYPSIS